MLHPTYKFIEAPIGVWKCSLTMYNLDISPKPALYGETGMIRGAAIDNVGFPAH